MILREISRKVAFFKHTCPRSLDPRPSYEHTHCEKTYKDHVLGLEINKRFKAGRAATKKVHSSPNRKARLSLLPTEPEAQRLKASGGGPQAPPELGALKQRQLSPTGRTGQDSCPGSWAGTREGSWAGP